MLTNMVPQEPLPLPVQQVAASLRLGTFVKIYRSSLVGTIIGLLVFLVMGLIFAGAGVFAEDETGNTRIVLLIMALLFLGLAVWMIYTAIQASNQRIYLFQQGMVMERGNQVQPFPWNQVAEVWQSITRRYQNGIYTGTTYMYTLRRMDGYRIKLNNTTKNIAELGPIVARGVSQELVPRALQALRMGQTLAFPPFHINQQGISNGQEFLPWSQVQTVDVKRGFVTVKKVGSRWAWRTAAVARIPNYLVFIVAVEHLRGQRSY